MGAKVTTVQTSKGDVYTGREVGRNDHAGLDMVTALCTAGLSELGGRSTPTVSVKVNDTVHTGREVKPK